MSTAIVERPSIFEISPIDDHKNYYDVSKFVLSAEIFIFELLFFYPKRDIFFIARDMEYHYDIAKLMLQKHSNLTKRIHLINISRDTLDAGFLKEYCIRNIFDICKKVVLVDSGFNGNVIEKVKELFPQHDIRGHLIYSENPKYYSSYAVMSCLGIPENEVPWKRKKFIEDHVEHLPHYLPKADDYIYSNDELVPISRKQQISVEWQKKSLEFMGRLRAQVEQSLKERAWLTKYEKMEKFVELISLIPKEKVLLDIRLEYLIDINASSITFPIGFNDFLREVKRRSENEHSTLRLVYDSCNHHLISLLTDKYNLNYFDVTFVEQSSSASSSRTVRIPEQLYKIKPSGTEIDYQYDYKKIWKLIDEYNTQEHINLDKLRKSMYQVMLLPGGMGFIRDILESVQQDQLGIYIKKEAIGEIWSMLNCSFIGCNTDFGGNYEKKQ